MGRLWDRCPHCRLSDETAGLLWFLVFRWNQFEEKWLSRVLMKPSVRKNQDHVFSVFHQLNLKDAASYVAEVSSGWVLEGFWTPTVDAARRLIPLASVAGRTPGLSGVCPQ